MGEERDQVFLNNLAHEYVTHQFLFGGIGKEAGLNNIRVVNALKNIGSRSSPNELYGIVLCGSRTLGIHTIDSDIDVILIAPISTNKRRTLTAINNYFVEHGLDPKVNTAPEMFSNFEFDPSRPVTDFITYVEQNPTGLASLFAYTPYENNNMLLLRLAVLRVINVNNVANHGVEDDWVIVQDWFVRKFIIERRYVVSKLAERVGTSQRLYWKYYYRRCCR